MKQLFIQLAISLFVFLLTISKLPAHAGEDHGPKQTKKSSASYFSSEKSTEKHEVLIKYGHLKPNEEGHLKLFISDVKTNAPVSASSLKISNPSNPEQTFEIHNTEAGIYEIHTKFPALASYNLHVRINSSLGADLIQLDGINTGKIPEAEKEQQNSLNNSPYLQFIYLGIALFLGLIIGLLMNRRSQKSRSAISLLMLFIFLFSPSNNLILHAHENHGSNKEQSTNTGVDFILAKETQFLFRVLTENTSVSEFTPSVELNGTITPTTSGRAVIQTPVAGTIKSLHTELGQTVRKGQLLAVIEQFSDANTQISWQTQKNALETELKAARSELERLRKLSDITAQREIEEAERRKNSAEKNYQEFVNLNSSSKSNSRLLFLYAPIQGKTEYFNFSIGANVNAGQEILSISNLNKVFVEAQVFEKDFNNAMKAIRYELKSKDHSINKNITLVSSAPNLNSGNQTMKLIFELDNPDQTYKLGEFVKLTAYYGTGKNGISVPLSSITEINGKQAVFVKESAEHYNVRYIKTGHSNSNAISVIEGLTENEKIVVNGTYQLKMIYLNQE